ncbi:unnamed protein product [Schistocephalus solidus]|uniref:Integrase_H2C2 domain-containing protein n=1 Tax=Schistocephalus solidus TaxID=70667 RepID=A0A183T201_SCHSO|nr:unnamed protein product [Schistocephalus solidus]
MGLDRSTTTALTNQLRSGISIGFGGVVGGGGGGSGSGDVCVRGDVCGGGGCGSGVDDGSGGGSSSGGGCAHIDGMKNEVADMLSRASLSALQLSQGIDLVPMTAGQRRVGFPGDKSVSGLQLADVPLATGTGTSLCDVSTAFHHPFVPTLMRRAVFHTLHGLSHAELRASQKFLAEMFAWPGMNKDVKAWTGSCLSCQQNKVRCHKKSPLGTLPNPDTRFGYVRLEVICPLPPSNGFTHLLTCVGHNTRWAEPIPLPSVEAGTNVNVFVSRRIAVFGAQSMVTTE